VSIRHKEGSLKNFKIKSNWGVGAVEISFLLSFFTALVYCIGIFLLASETYLRKDKKTIL